MQRDKKTISLSGQGGFGPFQDLDRHIVKTRLPGYQKPRAYLRASKPSPASECSDAELFAVAMADVKPLAEKGAYDRPAPQRPVQSEQPPLMHDEGRRVLQALVRHGIGFDVCHTPEYIQGSPMPIDRSLIKKLHQGKFAIEAHIDLHGLTAAQAAEALHRFIASALKSGKRSLLLIHGRGLSSPGPPVLKAVVERTLTQGLYRRWLLAYASARQCDGGAGATQVLFRRRPLTHKQIKQASHATRNF